VKRANDADDLSHDFGVDMILKALGPDEIARVRVDHDQVVFKGAARQYMRSIAPRQKIQGLVPERFSKKGRRRSPFAIHGNEERACERWMQRGGLSARPKDIVE